MRSVTIDADSGAILDMAKGVGAVDRALRGHVSLFGKLLTTAVGPLAHGKELLVSERLVAALGGSVRQDGKLCIAQGEMPVRLPLVRCARSGGRLFVPATALKAAFPGLIQQVLLDKKRKAVVFFAVTPDQSHQWVPGSSGGPVAPEAGGGTTPEQQVNRVLARVRDAGLELSPAELQRLLPARPEALKHLPGGAVQRGGLDWRVGAVSALALVLLLRVLGRRSRA